MTWIKIKAPLIKYLMLCSFPAIPYLLFKHITYLLMILILYQQLPRLVVTVLPDQQILYQKLFWMARLFQKKKTKLYKYLLVFKLIPRAF